MFPDIFQTARLLLRPIVPQDAGPMFDTYAQDPDVTRFLTWRPNRNCEETAAYIARCIAAPASRTYVILDPKDVTVRGAFDLRRVRPHCLGYGFVLARPWWGEGLMTEVLTEIVRWALTIESIWRIGDVCDVENIGSARVMEKAGLRREGILQRWAIHPNISDEPRDCFSYSRVR